MKKDKSYKTYTIKELIVALREIAEKGGCINLNSQVLISDYAMSGYKEKFKLHPVNRYGQFCVGLFHSLEESTEYKT